MIVNTWYPDFCHGGACAIEIEQDFSAGKRIISQCTAHAGKLFVDLVQISRDKEYARADIKASLGFGKEDPALPYSVEANGDITILLTPSQKAKYKNDVDLSATRTVRVA